MLRLEPRPQSSRLWTYASPLLALVLTVLLGIALFMALGKDPVRGLQMFFWEPVKTAYALGELMVKATPLLLIALGLSVCFRSNVWNIGAEGQFVIGAVCAGGMALLADKDTGRWIVLAVLLGPWLWRVPISDIDFSARMQPPTWAHPLGTDDLGQDLLARMLLSPQEMPVGVLTAVLGGGYLLWLMYRSQTTRAAR